MSKSLQVVLAVIRSIIAYCTSPQWAPTVHTVPRFETGISKLKDKERMINTYIKQQSEDIKGFTDTRRRCAISSSAFAMEKHRANLTKTVTWLIAFLTRVTNQCAAAGGFACNRWSF